METVTVSPKFQIVIPKEIREPLKTVPGQKMQVIEYAGRVELIPDRDITELRGFLKGIYYGIRTGERQGMNLVDSSGWLAEATIWTQDGDFKDLPNVKYFKKQSPVKR